MARSLFHSLFRGVARVALWALDVLVRRLDRRHPYNTLRLEVGGTLAEDRGFGGLPFRRTAVLDLLELSALLRWAAEDEQVQAVVLLVEPLDAGWARVQHLRRSIQALRGAGKYVLAYLTQAGTREYCVASVADAVAIAPAGHLTVTGLAAETLFFKGALDKLGVEAQVSQAGCYKSAGEPFTRTSLSEPHREMLNSLLDDLYDQIVEGIATCRGLPKTRVRELVDQGLFLPREAHAAGLIDQIGYEDDIPDWLESHVRQSPRAPRNGRLEIRRADPHAAESDPHGPSTADEVVQSVDAPAYRRRRRRLLRRRALRWPAYRLAYLSVAGTLTRGETEPGADGIRRTGSARVVRDLKQIRQDPGVAGVLVRVSSPGGSALAADLVWHALRQTAQDKPVVVSMGDVAASGGYYVALAGKTIFAEEGTLTGSIGVIAGKAVLRGLYTRLGLEKEILTRGRRAALFSDYQALGPAEQERMDVETHSFYRDFVEKTATCRSLSAASVHASAQGRVWSGRQALSRGLVDCIGGLDDALAELKRQAGIPDDGPVRIERFPKPTALLRFPPLLRLAPRRAWADGPSLAWEHDRVWAILPFFLRFL